MVAQVLSCQSGTVCNQTRALAGAHLQAVVVPCSVSAVRQDKVKDACSSVHLNVHAPPVAIV